MKADLQAEKRAAAPRPAPPGIVVRCRDLKKSFGSGEGEVQALRGVDLEVPCGELLMLVGPSGCGKTTLISVIAGILDRSSGRCEVLGTDHGAVPPEARALWRARNVGFVFQAFNLLPALSAQENVAVPLLIQGVRRSTALARAADMLEQVGLAAKRQALPTQLSGGQQQRVAIARALVHDPKLVVCDEPTSALDAKSGRHIMELFRALARAADRTLIVVTHDSRIFEFADRIAMMEDGRLDRFGSANTAAMRLH